ncbi:MAG: autotransporter-associated beta strand repeat-containing protein, partial [Puniceicoccales bacterium]|nr:autotransporter-associated beta strand repeat-containing protein [Puniceicoccales bacterium]
MKLARPALSASLASFAALALLASANVPSAGAAALTWRGHQSAVWDSATANWDNAAGTAATFAAGDAVTFPGTVADEAKRTVTLPANVAPADVTVDSALDYTIGGGSAGAFRIVSTGALIKRGAGKLTLLNATDAYNAFPGGMRVEGGTLTIGAAHIVTNSAYEISLSPNAVIEFALGDGVGSWGGAKILFTTRLAPGAQWRVVTGANTNNLGVAHLTGAVVDYSGSNDNSSLSGDIFVHANTENLAALAPTQGDARFNIGTAAAPTVSVISGSRTLNMGYSGGAAPTIRFDVEEAARLDVSVRLSNGQNGSGAAGINKTGAGEMRLSATNNAFTGAITVGGGKLTVMNAGAVVSTHEAALTVGDGAVLEFANANHFGVNTSARTVTLNGGALRYTGDTWTAIQGGQGWPDSTNNLNQFLDGAGGGVTIEVVAARTVLGGNRIAGNLTKTGAGWFYFGIDGKAIGDITVKAGGVVTKGDYSNAYNKQNGVIDVWEGAYFLGRHDNVIALSVAPTVTFKNDGTLDLRGCALTVGTLTDGSQNRATGVVTNTANAADLVSASWGVNADATLTVNAGDYSGVFADGTRKLSLTKATAGELVLGGASTHSGETLITGGVLRLRGTGAALRNSPVTVRSAATLAAGGGAELPETAAEANATVAFGSEPGHAGDETVRLTAGKTVALAAGARLAPQPGARGTTTVLDAAAGALALAPTGVVVTLPADYAAAPETFGAVVFRGLDPAARAALLAATLDPATAPAGASLVAGAAEDEVLLAAFAAPIFTTSPTATVNTAAGATATLAATAAGGGLVFQWFREGADGEDDSALADGDADANGSVITGAATATLVITGVRHADAGSYYCVATDIYGRTVRSTAAALAVAFVPIEILAAPQSITGAAPNSAATFSVTATCAAGDGLRYAWHFRPANDPQADFAPLADGAGVTGSATATLRLDAVLPANAGDYKVVITNGAFSEPVERTATLAFALPAVVFAAQPAGASARLLGTVAFAALATGDTSGG